MSFEKHAEANLLLETAGEVDSIRDTLARLGRIKEAQVLDKTHEGLLAEYDPEDLHTAAPDKKKNPLTTKITTKHTPMTQAQKQKYKRKLKMKKMPKKKRWLCCTKPVLTRIAHGKRVWVSTCKYKIMSGPTSGKVAVMSRIVGRDPKKRPTAITFGDGKKSPKMKVRWC